MSRSKETEPIVFWEEHIKRCQGSGLAIKEYCRGEGLREGAFFYWKRKLSSSGPHTNDLVEVKLRSSAPTPVEIILRNQIRLRLFHGCDTDMVLKLSGELERL